MSDIDDCIEVPIRCPLPAWCVVCTEATQTTIPLKATEGIPGLLSQHLTIHIPVCDAHTKHIKRIRFLGDVFIYLALSIFTVGIFLAFIFESLFLPIVICALILTALPAFRGMSIHSKATAESKIRLESMGQYPAYRLFVKNPLWREKLLQVISRYKELVEKNGRAG